MSVQNGSAAAGEGVVQERPAAGGIYASLFEKINLTPVAALSALDTWQDAQAMSEATADERLTAGMQVFLECLTRAGSKVEKLDKHLIDHHIAELDWQISRQLDAVMHHEAFQATESLWRGVKSLVDKTDFRQNVKIELLDMSKEDLRQDFEDSPEIIQSGLYKHTYIDEYDTPGGEPVAALISAYEFDASAQDVALLRSISKVSAAAHMPFIGSAGPKFFLKESMEEVAAIRDIGNYFDRAEYIKWKSFRETDDARYIGLVMPRVLGRLPYGPDTVPVRSFSYVEEVKGPDHDKYLWTSAAFAFASNMVRSFISNGWCVQIRGPQAGGAVQDLPIHLYDLGTGNQVKIPSEVMIPETREFEFANLGFIPLSYYKNRDYSCFFSANSTQKTALVEGLALRIAEGNVPESLKPVILRALDLGLLQAGAGVKGEFEQRLKNVIDAVQQSPTPILLFIDEAHTIIGAGNQAGGADAANLLKPALARGELRTIAATTWSEYKQYFEKDAALERRFQMVKVDEPDDDTACLMLRGLKSRYAEHHNVHITDDAVKAAVRQHHDSKIAVPQKTTGQTTRACLVYQQNAGRYRGVSPANDAASGADRRVAGGYRTEGRDAQYIRDGPAGGEWGF